MQQPVVGSPILLPRAARLSGQDTYSDAVERQWQTYFATMAPMGRLLVENALFQTIREGKGLTLVHITPQLEQIENSEVLLPSGGCLGASIYCTPLRSDGRLHNLSEFIIQRELPLSLTAQKKIVDSLDIVAIQLDQANFAIANQLQSGVDYLRLGPSYLWIFNDAADYCNLSQAEWAPVRDIVLGQFNRTRTFLELCAAHGLEDLASLEFEALLSEAICNMPLLGYVYFEVLLEYVLLFQNDTMAMRYRDENEMYVWHFKQLVFDMCPFLFKGFRLSQFNPRVVDVANYLQEKAEGSLIIRGFSMAEFSRFVQYRIAHYVRYKLLADGSVSPVGTSWTDLCCSLPSLIGLLVHRELRNIPELRELYLLYKSIRATVIWTHWRTQQVLVPYSCIVPKGEVGLNPLFRDLKYKVFLAKLDGVSGTLHIDREMRVKLGVALVDSRFSIMKDTA